MPEFTVVLPPGNSRWTERNIRRLSAAPVPHSGLLALHFADKHDSEAAASSRGRRYRVESGFPGSWLAALRRSEGDWVVFIPRNVLVSRSDLNLLANSVRFQDVLGASMTPFRFMAGDSLLYWCNRLLARAVIKLCHRPAADPLICLSKSKLAVIWAIPANRRRLIATLRSGDLQLAIREVTNLANDSNLTVRVLPPGYSRAIPHMHLPFSSWLLIFRKYASESWRVRTLPLWQILFWIMALSPDLRAATGVPEFLTGLSLLLVVWYRGYFFSEIRVTGDIPGFGNFFQKLLRLPVRMLAFTII